MLEEQITKLLEEAFASLQSLDYVESQIQKGESTTRLFFEDGRSIDAASADVREILSLLTEKLPEHAKIMVTKANADAAPIVEILFFVNESIPLIELHKVAEHTLKGSIENIPGVAIAVIFGGSELK